MVTHFFSTANVAALTLKEPLRLGDPVVVKGAHAELAFTVASMRVGHKETQEARPGGEVGRKVPGRARGGSTRHAADGDA